MLQPRVQFHKPCASLRRKTSALAVRAFSHQRVAPLRRAAAAQEQKAAILQESKARGGLQDELWKDGLWKSCS